jgi:hypothetical protein
VFENAKVANIRGLKDVLLAIVHITICYDFYYVGFKP